MKLMKIQLRLNIPSQSNELANLLLSWLPQIDNLQHKKHNNVNYYE